ncbi:MAG: hypothetical protein IH984_12470 [Planctomycetes bacterium]|nr:hypothetical protein [Planctomycetota bacterium]
MARTTSLTMALTSMISLMMLVTARSRAQMPCEYDVTIIAASTDCGIFGPVITVGLGINENGAVVGYYYCPLWEHTEAFVWTAEDGFVTLNRPEGVYSASAVDINDNGVICGTAWMFDIGQRGFVYEDGKMIILHPVVPDAGWSSANAINNAGVVVGQRSITENLSPQVAYMWSRNDGFVHLDGLEKLSSATAINGNFITGWTANTGEMKEGFLWDNGKVTLLGPIPGGFTSEAQSVTNNGIVVGKGRIPLKGAPVGASRAFVWELGKFTMPGTLPDHARSSASDVSDEEQQVVGRSWNVDGVPTIEHGFIWQNGIMHNLNDFIPPESPVLIKSAARITNSGQIIANGDTENGEIVAIILTPSPKPLGDLDNDCDVDLDDLVDLLDKWGEKDSPADLNQDGFVSTIDLLILFANWT